MLDLRKVAVTGGLSCGKSSVCLILRGLGAYVVSADSIVHQLLSSDTNLRREVVHLLGSDVLVNQQLDRSRIAQLAFRNVECLQALERLLHPLVYQELEKNYQEQRTLPIPPPLFVAEVPLLFESGGEKDYDKTVAVVADQKLCFARFDKATGLGPMEFYHRVERQLSISEKAARADYVITNNGTLSELERSTEELYQKLLQTPSPLESRF